MCAVIAYRAICPDCGKRNGTDKNRNVLPIKLVHEQYAYAHPTEIPLTAPCDAGFDVGTLDCPNSWPRRPSDGLIGFDDDKVTERRCQRYLRARHRKLLDERTRRRENIGRQQLQQMQRQTFAQDTLFVPEEEQQQERELIEEEQQQQEMTEEQQQQQQQEEQWQQEQWQQEQWQQEQWQQERILKLQELQQKVDLQSWQDREVSDILEIQELEENIAAYKQARQQAQARQQKRQHALQQVLQILQQVKAQQQLRQQQRKLDPRQQAQYQQEQIVRLRQLEQKLAQQPPSERQFSDMVEITKLQKMIQIYNKTHLQEPVMVVPMIVAPKMVAPKMGEPKVTDPMAVSSKVYQWLVAVPDTPETPESFEEYQKQVEAIDAEGDTIHFTGDTWAEMFVNPDAILDQ